MKKLLLFATVASLCACSPKATVTVENTLDFGRAPELVEIPVGELGIELTEGQAYVVTRGGETVVSQVTHDGLLLFPCGLAKGESATFTVKAGVPQQFPAKTHGRFVPERHDDFIWENDRVAFRTYGAALRAVDGPSNGIDALYKRTDQLVLEKWYADYLDKKISYHDDNGTGLDDFKVGRTLGAGAMAPYANYTLYLNSNFIGQELLDNGPLRTTFRLVYPGMALENLAVSETRTISIDAGMQMTRVVERYDFPTPMTVAAGFPLHGDNPEDAVFQKVGSDALMIEEPATVKSAGVRFGIVFPDGVRNIFRDSSSGTPHILALGVYNPSDRGYTYYTGYCWEQAGEWTSDRWARYLENFALSRKNPLVVTIR